MKKNKHKSKSLNNSNNSLLESSYNINNINNEYKISPNTSRKINSKNINNSSSSLILIQNQKKFFIEKNYAQMPASNFLEEMYLKYSKNLQKYFLKNQTGLKLSGNKYFHNLTVEEYMKQNNLTWDEFINLLNSGVPIDNQIFSNNGNNNLENKLKTEQFFLTPLPNKSRQLLNTNKEKSDFLEAERAAVVMRTFEYTHKIKSKVGIYEYKKLLMEQKQRLINLMLNAAQKIQRWWKKKYYYLNKSKNDDSFNKRLAYYKNMLNKKKAKVFNDKLNNYINYILKQKTKNFLIKLKNKSRNSIKKFYTINDWIKNIKICKEIKFKIIHDNNLYYIKKNNNIIKSLGFINSYFITKKSYITKSNDIYGSNTKDFQMKKIIFIQKIFRNFIKMKKGEIYGGNSKRQFNYINPNKILFLFNKNASIEAKKFKTYTKNNKDENSQINKKISEDVKKMVNLKSLSPIKINYINDEIYNGKNTTDILNKKNNIINTNKKDFIKKNNSYIKSNLNKRNNKSNIKNNNSDNDNNSNYSNFNKRTNYTRDNNLNDNKTNSSDNNNDNNAKNKLNNKISINNNNYNINKKLNNLKNKGVEKYNANKHIKYNRNEKNNLKSLISNFKNSDSHNNDKINKNNINNSDNNNFNVKENSININNNKSTENQINNLNNNNINNKDDIDNQYKYLNNFNNDDTNSYNNYNFKDTLNNINNDNDENDNNNCNFKNNNNYNKELNYNISNLDNLINAQNNDKQNYEPNINNNNFEIDKNQNLKIISNNGIIDNNGLINNNNSQNNNIINENKVIPKKINEDLKITKTKGKEHIPIKKNMKSLAVMNKIEAKKRKKNKLPYNGINQNKKKIINGNINNEFNLNSSSSLKKQVSFGLDNTPSDIINKNNFNSFLDNDNDNENENINNNNSINNYYNLSNNNEENNYNNSKTDSNNNNKIVKNTVTGTTQNKSIFNNLFEVEENELSLLNRKNNGQNKNNLLIDSLEIDNNKKIDKNIIKIINSNEKSLPPDINLDNYQQDSTLDYRDKRNKSNQKTISTSAILRLDTSNNPIPLNNILFNENMNAFQISGQICLNYIHRPYITNNYIYKIRKKYFSSDYNKCLNNLLNIKNNFISSKKALLDNDINKFIFFKKYFDRWKNITEMDSKPYTYSKIITSVCNNENNEKGEHFSYYCKINKSNQENDYFFLRISLGYQLLIKVFCGNNFKKFLYLLKRRRRKKYRAKTFFYNGYSKNIYNLFDFKIKLPILINKIIIKKYYGIFYHKFLYFSLNINNNIEYNLENNNICGLIREGYRKGYFGILYNILKERFNYEYYNTGIKFETFVKNILSLHN